MAARRRCCASYTGIEINPREVARARRALRSISGAPCRIVHGDIRDADYGAADAVVMLDVLHYIDSADAGASARRGARGAAAGRACCCCASVMPRAASASR